MGAAPMNETARLLAGNFSLCDLGSANSADLPGLRPLRRAITLIELDAIGAAQTASSDYYRKIVLQKAISGQAGRRLFHKRKYAPSSSFLEIKPELANAYGLQSLYAPDGTLELECETLASLLSGQGLARLDFLKTDLEGIDLEVLASSPDITGRSLVIQSELRFQPLYIGEPDFYAVGAFLAGLGFELITLRPEVWKYATPNRDRQRDGRLAWADAIFFLKPETVEQTFGDEAPLAFVKQVLLAHSLGLSNYAGFLFEPVRSQLPAPVAAEITAYLGHGTEALRLVNGLAALPGGNRALLAARRWLLAGARALSYVQTLKHIGFPL
jgi:hypothetical protein